MIRVFLDANVYFSGFVSQDGASFVVLELIRRGKITAAASRLVLREADRNLRKKSSARNLKAFRRFLQDTKIIVVQMASEPVSITYEELIHPKDLPVLNAAVESKADYLLTLDRKHFFNPRLLSKIKKPRIITPGDFIRNVYLK